jgi:hypothetical protein
LRYHLARMATSGESKARPRGARGTKSGGRSKRRKRREPAPVATGRFVTAAVILAALILVPFSPLGNLFVLREPDTADHGNWKVGSTAPVKVTLVTADFDRLFCASDKEIEGKRCAFKTEQERWPRQEQAPLDDNKKDVIQPYRTWPDNSLILLTGLWAQPEVALRLHQEPPAGVALDKLARFVVECQVKFIGSLPAPRLRWAPGDRWINEGDAMVGLPRECKVVSGDASDEVEDES